MLGEVVIAEVVAVEKVVEKTGVFVESGELLVMISAVPNDVGME